MNGPYPCVSALTTYKGDLIAGGWFNFAGDLPSVYWARWGLPQPVEGDLNHDCVVDGSDAQLLAERWLSDDCMFNSWCYEADLNYDFSVTFADLALFASHWLEGI